MKNNIRIGIVLHPFGNNSKGLEQHVFEIAKTMIVEVPSNIRYTVFIKGMADTSELPVGIEVVHLTNSPLWRMSLVRWIFKIDMFIFFTETAPFFLWFKSTIIFFDASYYYFYGRSIYSRLKRDILVWWRRILLQNVKRIVTISEASKRNLVENFFVVPKYITVIYPGFRALTTPPEILTEHPHTPYFIYVGPMKERKNVLRIVQAYFQFRKDTGLSHQLYLVGRSSKGKYETHVLSLIKESEYRDSVVFKSDVSDNELAYLYAHAVALVFPSLMEGFGLPILEALSLGCRVITSHTTSTKEVAGDVGVFVDPTSVSEISKALTFVVEEKENKEILKEKAYNQASTFTWSRFAREWNNFLAGIEF